MTTDAKKQQEPPLPSEITEQIVAALQGIRFGSVEITVHESKVVQIERKEKQRFDKNKL
ncbi:hypothetical protein JCM14076_19520 [Methylosoma difficile]